MRHVPRQIVVRMDLALAAATHVELCEFCEQHHVTPVVVTGHSTVADCSLVVLSGVPWDPHNLVAVMAQNQAEPACLFRDIRPTFWAPILHGFWSR